MDESTERPLSAIVLAAGHGTRMRSERPKPLHVLVGKPMVVWVIDALADCDVDRPDGAHRISLWLLSWRAL